MFQKIKGYSFQLSTGRPGTFMSKPALHTVTPATQSAKNVNNDHVLQCCEYDVIMFMYWSVSQSLCQGYCSYDFCVVYCLCLLLF